MPQTSNFKPGDRVRVTGYVGGVSLPDPSLLPVGSVWTVDGMYRISRQRWSVSGEEGGIHLVELVEPETVESPKGHAFKRGDHVCCIEADRCGDDLVWPGDILAVEHCRPPFFSARGTDSWYVDRFRLVEPEIVRAFADKVDRLAAALRDAGPRPEMVEPEPPEDIGLEFLKKWVETAAQRDMTERNSWYLGYETAIHHLAAAYGKRIQNVQRLELVDYEAGDGAAPES